MVRADEFPALKSQRVLSMLERLGYSELRRKGSHRRLVADARPPLTFAYHEGGEVPPKALRHLLMVQVGLTEDETRQLLGRRR